MNFSDFTKDFIVRWRSNYEKVSRSEEEQESVTVGSKSYMEKNASIYQESTQASWPSYRAKAIRLHTLFLAFYILITIVAVWRSKSTSNYLPLLNHSPATHILKTNRHIYNSTEESSYIREPSPENDQRWKDLTLGNFIRLSVEDLRKVGREKDAVYLEDGSGVGLVNAHHEVHCVMSLYHYSHPEYYWPNATDEQLKANRHHQDHCLDYLLQAAMCHGDVGYMTYHWDMEQPRPLWKPAEHTCINWDILRQWMRERRVPIHDPGFLVHPIFGPAYPDGVQSIPTIHDFH